MDVFLRLFQTFQQRLEPVAQKDFRSQCTVEWPFEPKQRSLEHAKLATLESQQLQNNCEVYQQEQQANIVFFLEKTNENDFN